MMILVVDSGCAAAEIEVGALDKPKLGIIDGLNDGIVLEYSLGKDDGSELGESVGIVDVEGASDGSADGDALRVGCSDGWLLGEVDMVGFIDGWLDGDVEIVGCCDGWPVGEVDSVGFVEG